MSERYSRLFSLPEDLYSVGSPVVIAAGALLKDNQTGKVIGQLKLRSISPKTIKAVKVMLNLFDTAGNPIGESVAHTYLDLNARRNEEFGQKSPVTVAESQTRSYQASVTEVVFEDQSVWTANEGTWEPLAKPVALSIRDPELLKQYQMHYGSGAKYEAKEEKDLWHCTCGALNHEGENCHRCGHSLFELQTVEMEKLTAEKDARLAEIARKAAEEQAATEAQKKKTTKILAIVIPAVCAVVAIILLATKVIIPNSKYNNAVKLMDSGSYEEAIVAFEAMDGYKDSVQKIADCELAVLEDKYNEAVALMDAGHYEAAITVFEALDGYNDSADKLHECQYANAIVLMDEGKYEEAFIIFESLGGYKDSVEKAEAAYEENKDEKLMQANVGDYVIFGSYEQDNNLDNGKEEIEWLVLDRMDNRLLVVSKYALDVVHYNNYAGLRDADGNRIDPTWEVSTVRNWLNYDFVYTAFSDSEKAKIPTITVYDNENTECATQDQIFLLSIMEVNKYFDSSNERLCKPTEYAQANDSGIDENGNCFWWLRTTAQKHSYAARVNKSGHIEDFDKFCAMAIRPAMWIDLEQVE